jgi:hypothetical protein
MGTNAQAQIRCSICQDRCDRRIDETCAEHYIRCASMVSMLDPPLSEEDLVGAMMSFSAGGTKQHDLRELKDDPRCISVFE